MLFNSWEFAIFLVSVFVLYWFVFQRNLRAQNLFIVAVSYLFYGWWDWRFLLLIAFTSACSFVSGILIEKYDDRPKLRRTVNIVNIIVNLLILGLFKYYDFFVSSFAGMFDADPNSLLLRVILPVGISFYTFQALSYSIDVYKKRLAATHDPIQLFAYISFFPQLVAGPIERATNLLPQFGLSRTFNYAEAVDGCRQMLWGFFKKIVIADTCAQGANNIFQNYDMANGGVLIVGAVLFSLQIYGDFSGYSDIAIGCSRLFGIRLMRNFNLPYFSRDIAEFWRRWHISLTTWFRDYIYIPLGGSRGSKWQSIRNTFIIFLISGFWHGANWTFLFWGFYHALLFLPLLLLGRNRAYRNTVASERALPSLRELAQMLTTFTLVVVGWIFFRAQNLHEAFGYIGRIFTHLTDSQGELTQFVPLTSLRTLAWTMPIFLIGEWLSRERNHGLDFGPTGPFRHRAVRWGVYYALAILILINAGEVETFIYFQF